jgi:sugar phosphate isomerase/epimerase
LADFRHAAVDTSAVRFPEIAQALRERQYTGPIVLEIVSQPPDDSIDHSVAYPRQHQLAHPAAKLTEI